ncbi:MAG: DNA-binding protein WhiA, partial [Clostridia bacterium]
ALIANDCCKRAYIKGLYSATGNLSVAENGKKGATGYYLEFSLASQNIANETVEILKSGGVEAKTREKKGAYYIYIKDSEKISDFCAFIGANKGYFALQEVILSRLVSNTANRQFNCEIANIDRTISAATKQTEAILYIKEHAGLESLPETLRITAEARLNHPSASVKELGTLLDTPASKSGISHRMRKIIEIATKLKENNPMLKEKIITAPRGIRAEDCAVIAQAASRYISDIFVIAAQKKVNAKSIMGLISLNMKKDDVVYLSVSGDDEKAAFEHINSLF